MQRDFNLELLIPFGFLFIQVTQVPVPVVNISCSTLSDLQVPLLSWDAEWDFAFGED